MSPPLGEGSEVAGKYRVVRHLGSGGMGHVYAALDLGRGETVALKVLPSDKRRDERARSRLVLEGRAAAGVQHPGIVRIYDVGEAGEITYVAMELLEGEDLHERMHRRGALPIDEVLALAGALLEAMGAMHDAGIIHRDLKPRNLFLARDASGRETLKVLDFGIAKSLAPTDHALTDSGQVFGTLHYMAPEQLRGVKHADVRSEIWAAGAILYEALTGRPPFEADNGPELVLKIAIEMPDPVRLHRPDVPGGLRRAIARAMQRDPAARFASAHEMQAAIDGGIEAPTLLDADTRPLDPDALALLGQLAREKRPCAATSAKRPWLRWPLVAGMAALAAMSVVRGPERGSDAAHAADRANSAAPLAPERSDGARVMMRAAEAALSRAATARAELSSTAALGTGSDESVSCELGSPRALAGQRVARPAAAAVATPSPRPASSSAASTRSPVDPPAAAGQRAVQGGVAVHTRVDRGTLSRREAVVDRAPHRPTANRHDAARHALPPPVPSSAGELKRDEL